MANYQRYQPRRSAGNIPWGRVLLVVVGLALILWATRSLLGSSPSSTETADMNVGGFDEIRLITDGQNTNSEALPGNTNAEESLPPEDTTPPDASLVALDRCSNAISRYGSEQVVALTFNLAAGNDNTNDLLNVLDKQNLEASFFSSGSFAENNGALVKRIVDAGYGVYNRSNTNPNMTELSTEQITEQLTAAETTISEATLVTSKPFLRPPFGAANQTVVDTAVAAGYCTILWTVDAFDWQDSATAQSALQRVLDKLTPGAIIMFSAGYDVTADAVELLAGDLEDEGYRTVSLVQLLALE